jgi:hypothetical protein
LPQYNGAPTLMRTLVIGFMSVWSTVVLANQPSLLDAGGVEITLGETTVRGSSFVVQLGLVPNDKPINLALGVRSLTAKTSMLEVQGNSAVSAEWGDSNTSGQQDSHQSKEIAPRQLLIELKTQQGSEIPILKLQVGKALLAAIGFSMAPKPSDLAINVSDSYYSSRSWHQPAVYTLCTGRLPLGYDLNCKSLTIRASSVSYPDRGCGKGVFCPTAGCTDVAPRGFCTKVAIEPTTAPALFDLSLTGQFVLHKWVAQLRTLSPALERQIACGKEWEQFIASHQDMPQFALLPSDTRVPLPRSDPCGAYQSSAVVFLGGVATEEIRYGGIRMNTYGRPVLVGIIPDPFPFQGQVPMRGISGGLLVVGGQSSSSWEISILRDSRVEVGSFRVGTMKQLKFDLPSSFSAIDTPPKGMHTYTLLAKGEGTSIVLNQARLYGYELHHDSRSGNELR